jgi:phospholipid/cholesterol/gamma-HCH transport system substrate-binding protein
MSKAIKDHFRDMMAILGLLAIAMTVGVYILNKQRLRFPLIEETPYRLKAAFDTAQAVTPGQGQTVRVSGIRIGDIAKTELVDGRAIVTFDIDQKYKDLVHTDATALLRPKTGLKDMFIEVNPGTKTAPVAEENWVMPISNTLPDVNPDEFFAMLDADTRDYLALLLKGAADGLRGRSADLRDVLKRFEPTHRDLAAVQSAAATRRTELRRLIHSLNLVNRELGDKDDELAELVDRASRWFGALADERQNVAGTIREFPSTLKQATSTLGKVDRLARVLGPASEELRQIAAPLERSNRLGLPLSLEAEPLLREKIRPFVREARPFVGELGVTARRLVRAEPGLTDTFKVLNRFFNMLAHNPNGAEGPEKADRNEGFLFSLAWVGHQSTNLFSSQDAHGPGRPITTGGTCGIIRSTIASQPQLEDLLGLSGALTDPRICGEANG